MRGAIDAIRSLWDNESWESIVEKFQSEGSTWIVWWNDGVNNYMALDLGRIIGRADFLKIG